MMQYGGNYSTMLGAALIFMGDMMCVHSCVCSLSPHSPLLFNVEFEKLGVAWEQASECVCV